MQHHTHQNPIEAVPAPRLVESPMSPEQLAERQAEIGSRLISLERRLDTLEASLNRIVGEQTRFYRAADGWQRVTSLDARVAGLESAVKTAHDTRQSDWARTQPHPGWAGYHQGGGGGQQADGIGAKIRESAGVTIPISVILAVAEVIRIWLQAQAG